MPHPRPSQIIAGYPLIACPACHTTVRADLLGEHATRCSGRAQPGMDASPQALNGSHAAASTPSIPAPTQQQAPVAPKKQQIVPMPSPAERQAAAQRHRGFAACPICHTQIVTAQLDDHQRGCARRHDLIEQMDAMNRPEVHDTTKRTVEGYAIEHCWECRRRVCLVPRGHTLVRAHEIVSGRMCGEPHMCDGQPGERRSKLVYVDPKIAQVAPRDTITAPKRKPKQKPRKSR